MADIPTPEEAEAEMLRGFRGESGPPSELKVTLTAGRLVIEGDPVAVASIAAKVAVGTAPAVAVRRVTE